MAKAPAKDQGVMAREDWQRAFVIAVQEALTQGVDGWMDEGMVIDGDWVDVSVESVQTTVTWWHGAADANAPLSSAQRLVARIPHCELRLFGEDEGHMAGYHREAEILDELLARG